MSVQSKIDFYRTKEGGNQYNMVIKDEAGDAIIPDGVNVSFYNCKIGKLEANKNNAIYIGGGDSIVKGTLKQVGGSFVADGVIFKEKVHFKEGTRIVKAEKCYFKKELLIEENCYGDFYNCDISGAGEYGIKTTERSKIILSSCKVRDREKAMLVLSGSAVDFVNSSVSKTNVRGIRLEGNSFLNSNNSSIAPTKIAVESYDRCQITVNGGSIDGGSYGVYLGNGVRFNAQGAMIKGNTAIHAKQNCILDVYGGDGIMGNVYGIELLENCKGTVIGTKQIKSSGATAIKLEDGCSLTCIDVPIIQGMGAKGAEISQNSNLELVSKGSAEIIGITAGAEASEGSKLTINRYKNVQGLGGDGIVLDQGAKCHLSKVKNVQGMAGKGVKMSSNSLLSAQDCSNIQGMAGDGITASNDCKVQLQTVKSVQGLAGSGIKVSSGTSLDALYVSSIEGLAGCGVEGSSQCDIKISRCTTINGTLGGVKNTSSGSLHMERVQTVKSAVPYGILAQSQVDTTLINLSSVIKGIYTKDCIVRIKDCMNITNDSGIGLTVDGGEVKVNNINAQGSSASIMFANTLATATNVILLKDITSQQSTINLNNVTLTGSIYALNDVYHMNRVTVSLGNILTLNTAVHWEVGSLTGSIVSTNGAFNSELLSCLGSLTLINSTGDVELTSFMGALTLTNSSMDLEISSFASGGVLAASHLKCRQSAVAALALAGGSSLDVMGGAVGAIVLDTSSTCILQACAAAVSGSGHVVALNPAAVTPSMNQVTLDYLGIHLINMYRAQLDLNTINIIENTITSGGNIYLLSTVATQVS
jgi:hypothetical protein